MALTEYNPVGNPSDVSNVNPYTGQAWNLQNMIAQSMMGSGVMDPLTAMNQFLARGGVGEGLMGMALGATSPYAQAVGAQAARVAPQAVQTALTPYLQSGGFYGSGAVGAATQAAGDVYANAMERTLAAQTGMAGNLLTSGLGALTSGYGNQMGLFGNVLGGLGQYGAQEWWQPQYVEQMTGAGGALAILGAGTDLLSGIMALS